MTNSVRINTSAPGAKQATKEVTSLRGAVETVQKQGAKPLLSGIAAGATFAGINAIGSAISGVGDFMGTAIQRASDLAESQSKVNVVFGEGAREVEKWAETAAESFGQSKQQALEAAGTYGNLFQAFGIGQVKAQEMSMTLVELAADLASFNNTSVEDAIQALRSGLSGETEPLKRYGIALSDARMRQVLMAEGIKDLGATLTPLQKSQAAYTLILKDSTLAQGDFERTADGVANTIRSNTAAIADMEAEIGTKAIPAQKAWLELQKQTFDTIGAQLTLHDEHAAKLDKLNAALVTLRDSWMANTPWGKAAIEQTEKQIEVEEAAASAVSEHGDSLIGLRLRTSQVIPPIEDFEAAQKEAAAAAEELDREIDGLADTISDELFGDAINKGNLASLRQTHKELEKQREEVQKGTPKWRILTGEIAENEQAQFDLQLQMKEKEGPKAVIAWLQRQKELFGDANGRIQTLIDSYRELDRAQASVGGVFSGGPKSIGTKHRASGGPVKADEAYIVGEEGEELFVPNSDGRIIPNGGTGSAASVGGGGLTINVTGVSVLTPGSAEALARQLEPIITRTQQRQGHLARRV